MKCERCGAELKKNCLYCSVCGAEIQLVPDYNVLEDDYLSSLMGDREAEHHAGAGERSRGKADASPKPYGMIAGIVLLCIAVIAIVVGCAVKLSVDRRNANSYDYQIEMAGQCLADADESGALSYYQAALALKPQDITVRMDMADIYLSRDDFDPALVLLIEIIGLDSDNLEAYEKLIGIYDDRGDYDSIRELAGNIRDEEIQALFSPYFAEKPVMDPEGGTYKDAVSVTLFSVEDNPIYYTLDGEIPDEENGILYEENSVLKLDKAGTYEIMAVCQNEKGIYSDVAKAAYTIEYDPPAYPTVTPDGGRIEEPTTVSIGIPAGCVVYYTWDGTTPTTDSMRYEEPLEIPEGNNVLSVIAIDGKTGLDSGVYRTNFIYYP